MNPTPHPTPRNESFGDRVLVTLAVDAKNIGRLIAAADVLAAVHAGRIPPAVLAAWRTLRPALVEWRATLANQEKQKP